MSYKKRTTRKTNRCVLPLISSSLENPAGLALLFTLCIVIPLVAGGCRLQADVTV